MGKSVLGNSIEDVFLLRHFLLPPTTGDATHVQTNRRLTRTFGSA